MRRIIQPFTIVERVLRDRIAIYSIALQQLRCPRDFCRTFSSANYANLR